MPKRWQLREEYRVNSTGVETFFILRFDGTEMELEVDEAQALATDLVLAIDRVDPGRWRRP